MLTSTTSHKREPLLPTLEVFARLGLRDLDLNLHHILEDGVPVDAVAQSVAANGLASVDRVRRLVRFLPRRAGDRARRSPRSIAQVAHRRRSSASSPLRLFFGRLDLRGLLARRAGHGVRRTSGGCPTGIPAMRFVFENHDGASLHPGRLPRDSRPRRPAEHPDELRSDQLREGRRRSSRARSTPAAAGRRSRAPEGARTRRVLRVRRRRRRSRRRCLAVARSAAATRARSPSSTKAASTARCACTAASTGRSGKSEGY